jgi:hypothetical protein
MSDSFRPPEDAIAPLWREVEHRALCDPFLRRLVGLVRSGQRSREEALISIVLELSALRERMLNAEAERLSRALPLPTVAWQERGRADKQAIADTLSSLMGATAAGPYVTHLERAIDALDKP